MHQEERDDRDREQDRDDPQEPPADVCDHGISRLIESSRRGETRWAGLSADPPALIAEGD
jgi:hypothetical protein